MGSATNATGSDNKCRRTRTAWRVGLILALTVLTFVSAYVVLFSDRPPSPDVIHQRVAIQPFLVDGKNIEGHFRNHDIDSLVFTYTTSLAREGGFWQRVNAAAERAGWRAIQDAGPVKRFERVEQRGGAGWWSAELVHVYMDPGTGFVVVAWVQGDSTSQVDTFAETRESQWAERVVWPQVTRLAEGPE